MPYFIDKFANKYPMLNLISAYDEPHWVTKFGKGKAGMIIDNMKRIFEIADSDGFLNVNSDIHIKIVPEINLTKDKLVLFQPDCFLIRRHHEIISQFNDGLARVGRYHFEELKPEQMEAFFAKCHKIGEIFHFKSNSKLFRIQTKSDLTL